MIIIKLWGGLCNQMFQYAFGYALSRNFGDELYFDDRYFYEQRRNVGKRKVVIDSYFSLSKFQIIERPHKFDLYENRYVNRIIRSIASGKQIKCGKNYYFYKEPTRQYQESIPYIKENINYYDGYWLSSKYFVKYRNEIKEEFRLDERLREEVNNHMIRALEENSVALHIRRGDYLNKKNTPKGYNEQALAQYYQRAIRYIISRVRNPIFYVFSDDIKWCEKNIETFGYDKKFVQNNKEKGDLLDLYCISSCRHGIMSPSTFSWWGNWLREDKSNSLVILPAGNYSNNKFAEKDWITM